MPVPSPGHLPNPGIKPTSPALQILHPLSLQGSPLEAAVQSLRYVQFFEAPWTAARQAALSFTVSQNLLKPMSVESMLPPSHLVLSSLSPPAFSLSSSTVFSNDSALHIRRPKYWSFSFSISPSNEHSGLISFMMDWFELLAVQGTLKSFLQHHSLKASVLWCSVFFMVQLSYPCMTAKKTIAWTIWTFVGKVMSPLR